MIYFRNFSIHFRYFVHFYFAGVVLQAVILVLYLTVDDSGFDQLVDLNQWIFSSRSIQFLGSYFVPLLVSFQIREP